MKRARLSLLEDLYFFCTFLLDFAVLAVVIVFALRGQDASAFDELQFVSGYALVCNALNIASLGLYYAQSFAFTELHFCLFSLRLSLALAFWFNAAISLYSKLTQQSRLGATRFEFQVMWFLGFFCNGVLNALLVRALLPHFRPRAKSAVEEAMGCIRLAGA